MPIHIPPLTIKEISDAAVKCLADTHQAGTIPVPIEDIIDVGFAIDLVPTMGMEEKFGALAFITHDLKEIRVDDHVYRKQAYRLRFSLAHELGHLILHQGVYKQMVFQTPNEWKQAMTALGQANYQRLESQADKFAGFLLVPSNHLRNEFGNITTALAQGGKTFKQLSSDTQDYAVKGLARIFNVSAGAIWYRLRDEGFV